MKTAIENDVQLEPMVTDDDNVRVLPFPVSETLASKLDDQRDKLDKVNPSLSGKERYTAARNEGCFAAIAKGAKDRELKADRLFIPGSEISSVNGRIRISAFKASLPLADGIRTDGSNIRSITFLRESDVWTGQLEVKENA